MSKEVVDTISKACAYGDFDKLKQFFSENPASVNQPDESGYYPLQWAALNNRTVEVNYLLSVGAAMNAADGTGQTALHWAAALKWNVDVDTHDTDGRTPLHWAAYKGFPDTIRLLLTLDARYTLADKEGCTPLHWAAIKGNGEACTVLLQGGSVNVLTYKDVTGLTPAQLALEKGHRYLGLHLAEYKRKQDGDGLFGRNGRLSWLTSTQLAPALWVYAVLLSTTFMYKVMGSTQSEPAGQLLSAFGWSVVISVALGLVFLYKTTTSDPGFIPTGADTNSKDKGTESDTSRLLSGQHKALDSPALWAGNWGQLCVSCRIVRPLRAKHCQVTDRCIEVYDHYCPWVGNAIGKGNRHFFLVFVWLELYGMVISAIVGLIQIQAHLHTNRVNMSTIAWLVGFEVVDVFVMIATAALAIAQASQVARNVTTNELANWHRYKYLHGPDGSFVNPFSHSCWENCVESFTPAQQKMAPVYLSHSSKLHAGSAGNV